VSGRSSRGRDKPRLIFLAFRLVPALAVSALAFAPISAIAQSPPAPDVVFKGDFETGKLSPWPGGQCANTGLQSSAETTRGTVNLTVRLVGQGRYAARFNLPAAGTSQACELLDGRPIGLGTDDYYGLMVMFPKTWREPSPRGWGLAIAQLNFQGIHGPPVGLFAHGNSIELAMQTGLCGSSRCAYSSGREGNVTPMAAVPAPLTRGVWHELIVHVHWTTDSSGVVEAWHRLKGQKAWRKTVSLRGYPTVQWTPDRLSILSYNATVDKIGAYRGSAAFPLSIWSDGFVRATTFAAAATALP
jgi:hypothetical protein